ncbi:MAG: tyrosine-type recombinase/integrase [Cocleimonas sp.]|nr:tyrosine-type recombinase/integrase [Cocleimonas sp.]
MKQRQNRLGDTTLALKNEAKNVELTERPFVFTKGEGNENIEALIQRTKKTLRGDLADATHLAYEKDWNDFQQFTQLIEQPSLPAQAEIIVLYLQYLADKSLKLNTIRRRLAAIRYYHFSSNYDSPTESALGKKMLNAISRQIGYQLEQKQALLVDDLKRIIDLIPCNTLSHYRDRALLLLGFAGGFRRGEVISLRVEQLFFSGEHLRVHLFRSKTDQTGKGIDKPIFGEPDSPYCPVIALRDWLKKSEISEGYIFRRIRRGQCLNRSEDKPLSVIAYTNCIKHYAKKIGLNHQNISGHSLRSGFVTSAALQGKDVLQIAAVTQQDIRTVQRYMRKAKLFEQHAGEGLLNNKK